MDKKQGAAKKLLEAAGHELIANDGHMEMSAVAKRAGVSVGLAYHHFGSKTGLVAAVVDDFYGPIREVALGDAIAADVDWEKREWARAKALIDYFYDHPLAPLVAGRLAREPEVLDIEQAHMQALLELGARNIQQGQRLGVVAPELHADVTVAMLMGGMRLVIDQAVMAPSRPPKEELLSQLWTLCRGALQLDQNMKTKE